MTDEASKTGDNNSSLTVTYDPNVRLVKIDVYYKYAETIVAGGTYDTVTGVSGDWEKLEEDTVRVYAYPENAKSKDGETDLSGKPIEAPEGESSKYYIYADGSDESVLTKAITQAKATSNIGEVTELPTTKIYLTNPGLHTDKTATVNSEDASGRTFDLDLEAWFSGENVAEVGLVLDSSGSMAFTSDKPGAEDESGNKLFDIVNVKDYSKELEEKWGSVQSKFIEAPDSPNASIDWEDKFLTSDELNAILDPLKTDNSPNGYNGYSYYIYDSKSTTKEFVPIGYVDKNDYTLKDGISVSAEHIATDFPKYGYLIGYYPFNSGEELKNVLTGKEATAVAKLADTSNINFVEDTDSTGKLSFDSTNGYKIKESEDGILLDVRPTGNNFTISFAITKGSGDSSEKNTQTECNLFYIGPISVAGDEAYNRIVRPSTNSRNRARVLDNKDKNICSVNNVFNNMTKRQYLTFVFTDESVTFYVDGDIKESDQDLTGQFGNLNYHQIIMGGFAGYKDAEFTIDDLYIYDTDLSEKEVKKLYSDFQSKNKNGKNHWLTTDNENISTHVLEKNDESGTILASTNEKITTTNYTSGWFYVSSSSNFNTNLLLFGTAKDYRPLLWGETKSSNHNYVDYKYAPVPEGKYGNSTGELTDGDYYTYKMKQDEYSPLQFFVDKDGYLCCFYNSGSASNEEKNLDRYGWSYVYEKVDDSPTKEEVLQRALGLFATRLHEATPSSRISAVKFSTDEINIADYDQLVLLDWTTVNDSAAEAVQVINPNMGEGDKKGTPNGHGTSANNVEQYNYILTGGTHTYTGLQSFIDNLAKRGSPDVEKKYLIIFTDGKDDDYKNAISGLSSDEELKTAIEGTEAYKLATELRDKYNYEIFAVMLSGGTVSQELSPVDYSQTVKFLAMLTGEAIDSNKTAITTSTSPGDNTYENVYESNNAPGLVQIFSESIVERISDDLSAYTVKDYLDPRFNLVDASGNVWKLNRDGAVEVVSIDADGKETPRETYDLLSGETSAPITLAGAHRDDEGSSAHLHYDSAKNLYYLEWDNTTIPGCDSSAEQIPVWNARVTVRAKDDFIGGNTVMTNGNAAGENYVYMNDDVNSSSGTGDYEGKRDESDIKKFTNYPSKGFPRTTVNVQIPNIAIGGGKQVIFMGEDLTSAGVAKLLGKTIVDQWTKESSGTEESEGDGADETDNVMLTSKWYWEYLRRYAGYDTHEFDGTEDDIYKTFDDIVTAIINAENSDDKSISFPYAYLPEPSSSEGDVPKDDDFDEDLLDNQSGTNLHESDRLGTLKFEWVTVKEGSEPYPADKVTKDTKERTSALTVTYTPYAPYEEGDERKTGNDNLQTETDGDTKIYEWDSSYKPTAGNEIKDPVTCSGDYTTYIVSGETAFDMKLPRDVVEYLEEHYAGQTLTYTAELKRTYGEINEKVADVVAKFEITDDETAETAVPATITYVDPYKAYVDDYGLPIGTYTFEKVSAMVGDVEADKLGINFADIEVDTIDKATKDKTVAGRFPHYKAGETKFAAEYLDEDATKSTSITDFQAEYGTNGEIYIGTAAKEAAAAIADAPEDESAGNPLDSRYGYAYVSASISPESANLSITKESKNSDETEVNEVNKDDEFSFTLKLFTDADKTTPFTGNAFEYEKIKTDEPAQTGTVEFDKTGSYSFTLKAGETLTIKDLPVGLYYTVKEAELAGYNPEENPCDGTLVIGDNKVTFTNVFDVGSLTISKTVTGDGGDKDKAFNFEVKLYKPNSEDEELDGSYDYTGKNGASNGKITNGTGTFKLKDGQSITISGLPVGTTYSVTESEANQDGYVTKDSEGNVIDKFIGEISETNTEEKFINYKPAPVDWTVSVEKQIDDKGKTDRGKNWTKDDKYVFTITTTATDGVTFDGEKTVTLDMNSSKKNDKVRTGNFGKITFTKAGEYTFTISETEGNIDGITYDKTVYTVTVKVEDKGGKLEVTETIKKLVEGEEPATVDSIIFTNTYDPDAAPVDIPITKEFTGGTITKDSEDFELKFTLEDTDETSGAAPVVVTMTRDDYINEAEKSFNLSIDTAGTYTYTVTEEVTTGGDCYTNDSTVYTVIVTVTDNNGTLLATETVVKKPNEKGELDGVDGIVFTNTVKTGSLTITKTVTGDDGDKDKAFNFTVNFTAPHEQGEQEEQAKPLTGKYTVKNSASDGTDGTIELTNGTYTFTLAHGQSITISGLPVGTTYSVTESEANQDGYVTSSTGETGTIVENVESTAAFTNEYKPAPVDVEVSVTKTLKGREWLNTDTFTFELVADQKDENTVNAVKDESIVLPDDNKATAGNTETHTAQFGAITFTKAGEYKFEVRETEGNIDGITYDDTVYTVTVTVTDVGGQLTARVAYSDNKGHTGLSDITFTNTYTPDPVPEVKIEKTQAVGDNATVDKSTKEEVLTVKPGDTVTYFLTVTNTVEGSVATDVTVTDDIPEGLTLVEINNDGVNNGGTITWTIDKLEFNKPVVLSFSVKVPDEAKKASWSNFATVTYPNPDDPNNPNTDVSETVTINEPAPKVNPKVTVVKTQAVGADATVGGSTDKDLTVNPGDTVTYFLTVSASGGSEGSVAEDITVTDKIPEGLKLVEGSITNGGANNDGIITWTVDVENGIITWTIDKLANDDSVVLSFKVTVPKVGEELKTRSWKNAAQLNGKDTNTVTVTENLGNLRITKRVSGNDGDRTEAFRFTLGIYTDSVNKTSVAIADTAVFTITGSDNKPVGSAEFVDGVCEFTLAHGQSLTVNGLPAGAYFEVREIDSGEGYETKATVNGDSKNVITGTDGVIASGTIAKDSTVTASFNNYRHKTVQTGSLTVRKTVASPNIDPDAVYTFNYTLTLPQYSEEPTLTYRITGIYGESGGSGRLRPDSIIPDAAGRLIVAGTFTLKHNQKIVISGIPVDTDYEVREDVPAGYILSTYKDTGTVSAVERNHTAVFVNTEYIPGSLTVSKTAIGSEADPYSFFDFVVVLYNDAQMTEIATNISGFYGDEVTYKGMLFENGVAYVTLSDGESCTATGLPGNLYYTVVETDNGEGYTPELAVPVGQTPLLTFNTPNVFDVPHAPDGTVVPDEPVADEPVAEPVVTGEPVVTDKPMPADEMSGEPVASEPDIIPDGTTTADEPVLPDETASDGNNIPFDLPMPIDKPVESAYGSTVSGAISETGTASFVNIKNVDVDVRTGELVIEKHVTGHGDREYGFGFKVEFFTDATFLTDVTADNYADIYAVVIKDTPGAETEGEEFVEISAGIGTFTLRDGESVCIGGIPDGTYFRVTEYDADGHTVSVTGDCITLNEYSVYGAVSGDDSAHVIFNNNLPENHAVPVDATLRIAKSFSAPGATSRGDLTFNFTITEEPERTSAPKTDRVTVYSGEDNPEETGTSHGITLSFPEAGTYTYSVKEEPISDDADKYEGITTVKEPVEVVINVAANADGTLYIASATVDGKSVENVEDTKLILVSFVNPYEPPATEPDEPEPATVELKIEKSFSAPGATSRGDLTFNFKVTKESEESSTPVSVKVKKDAESGTSDDAVKLSFDAAGEYTYYVSEEPISDDTDKYEGITTVEKPVKVVIDVAAHDDGTLYIFSATVDGEPVADTKLITVSFENTYEPPATEPDEPVPATGSLTLSKVLYINNRIVRGVGQFRFRIELDSDFTGGRFSNGVAEVVLAAGESITLEGLPAGARYTVSEYNTYGYTLLVRESTGLSGTIPEDGEAKAAAVNVRVDTWQPSAPPIGGPVGGEPPAETPEVEPPTEAGQTDEDGVEGPAPSTGFLSGAAAALMMGAAAIALKLKRR